MRPVYSVLTGHQESKITIVQLCSTKQKTATGLQVIKKLNQEIYAQGQAEEKPGKVDGPATSTREVVTKRVSATTALGSTEPGKAIPGIAESAAASKSSSNERGRTEKGMSGAAPRD
jgi:hypothetical protein